MVITRRLHLMRETNHRTHAPRMRQLLDSRGLYSGGAHTIRHNHRCAAGVHHFLFEVLSLTSAVDRNKAYRLSNLDRSYLRHYAALETGPALSAAMLTSPTTPLPDLRSEQSHPVAD